MPVSKDQILYVQQMDGTWKLNSKISPIDVPEGKEFKGYFCGHDKRQAYAYFTREQAGCPGTRRGRLRGGRWKESYNKYYNGQRSWVDRGQTLPAGVQ